MNEYEVCNGLKITESNDGTSWYPVAKVINRGDFQDTLLHTFENEESFRTRLLQTMRNHGFLGLNIPLHEDEMRDNCFHTCWRHVRQVQQGVTRVMLFSELREAILRSFDFAEEQFLGTPEQNPPVVFLGALDTLLGERYEDEVERVIKEQNVQIWKIDFATRSRTALLLDDQKTIHGGEYHSGNLQSLHAESSMPGRILAFTTSKDGENFWSAIRSTTL